MRNALWFIIGGIVLALAFALRSPYLAYAAYAFLLLVGIAHFSSWAWLSGLDCQRTVDRATVHQGESITVDVAVENRRGWPIPWLYVEDLHPADFARAGDNARLAVLMPGRSLRFQYTLTCPRRGYHRIGPLLMESGDLFGLQRRFVTGKRQDYVSVLPTVAYIETFTIAARRPQGPVRITNRIYDFAVALAGLEARGLVERASCPEDRRGQFAVLTAGPERAILVGQERQRRLYAFSPHDAISHESTVEREA